MKLDHQVSKELGAGAKEELIPGEEQVNFEKLVVGPLKNIEWRGFQLFHVDVNSKSFQSLFVNIYAEANILDKSLSLTILFEGLQQSWYS